MVDSTRTEGDGTTSANTTIFSESHAFSGFSVDDLGRARDFYAGTLGLTVSDVEGMGPLMRLRLAGGRDVLVYEKEDHVPATFTILNFPVPDVDAAVEELARRGVSLLRYDGFPQDDTGVMRGQGPAIGWFSDPAGNVLSVLEQD
jgi:predicted enzyme related to lactoylglutathione lyase